MALLLTNEEIFPALRGKTEFENSCLKGQGTSVSLLLLCRRCGGKSGD